MVDPCEYGSTKEASSKLPRSTEVDGRHVNQVPNACLGLSNKDKLPAALEEKRFMIYICGGYKGRDGQT